MFLRNMRSLVAEVVARRQWKANLVVPKNVEISCLNAMNRDVIMLQKALLTKDKITPDILANVINTEADIHMRAKLLMKSHKNYFL